MWCGVETGKFKAVRKVKQLHPLKVTPPVSSLLETGMVQVGCDLVCPTPCRQVMWAFTASSPDSYLSCQLPHYFLFSSTRHEINIPYLRGYNRVCHNLLHTSGSTRILEKNVQCPILILLKPQQRYFITWICLEQYFRGFYWHYFWNYDYFSIRFFEIIIISVYLLSMPNQNLSRD